MNTLAAAAQQIAEVDRSVLGTRRGTGRRPSSYPYQDTPRPVEIGKLAAGLLDRGGLPDVIIALADYGLLSAGDRLTWSNELRGWRDRRGLIVASAYQVREHLGQLYTIAEAQP